MATSEYPTKIIVSIVLIISDIPRQITFIPIIGIHFDAKGKKKKREKKKKEKKSPPPFFGSGDCGAGGNRTRVRTRKPYAFYMLIPVFIFVLSQDPGHQRQPYPLNLHLCIKACKGYSRFSCAAESSDSEQHPWSDVSFHHLVTE